MKMRRHLPFVVATSRLRILHRRRSVRKLGPRTHWTDRIRTVAITRCTILQFRQCNPKAHICANRRFWSGFSEPTSSYGSVEQFDSWNITPGRKYCYTFTFSPVIPNRPTRIRRSFEFQFCLTGKKARTSVFIIDRPTRLTYHPLVYLVVFARYLVSVFLRYETKVMPWRWGIRSLNITEKYRLCWNALWSKRLRVMLI